MGGKVSSMTPAYQRILKNTNHLNREQELELIVQYRAGDRAARDVLVLSNQKYVIQIATPYARRTPGTSLDDLVNEGNIGLLKALDKYNLDKGVRFITYASYWIRASIRECVMNRARQVHLTTAKAERRMHSTIARERHRIEYELACKYGTSPAYLQKEIYEGLAEHFGVSTERIRTFEQAQQSYAHLDTIGAGSQDDDPANVIELGVDTVDSLVDKRTSESLGKILSEAMGILTKKERDILKRRFGITRKKSDPHPEPETLQKISVDYKVSRERIRQIEGRAIKKLRAAVKEELMLFPEEHLTYRR